MVKVRPYYHDRKQWQVDIRFTWPEDRSVYRERARAPVASKTGALRWGQAREAALLAGCKSALKPPEPPKEVPTLAAFEDRFMEHSVANKEKASGRHGKEEIFRTYLRPKLGAKRLDEIGEEDISKLKASMATQSKKTLANVLTVLSSALKLACKWNVITTVPRIERVRYTRPAPGFYSFEDFDRLVAAAKKVGAAAHVLVLLGGRAGLRRGEMLGLRWCDVDLRRAQIMVSQAIWKGVVDVPKNGKEEPVDMPQVLCDALREYGKGRPKTERVLRRADGEETTEHTLRDWLEAAQKKAGLRATGGTHILRHTFVSHLAMRGAAPRAIQKLARHSDLNTTQRYMHLVPGEGARAVALLDVVAQPGHSRVA
jgi:integrase